MGALTERDYSLIAELDDDECKAREDGAVTVESGVRPIAKAFMSTGEGEGWPEQQPGNIRLEADLLAAHPFLESDAAGLDMQLEKHGVAGACISSC
ncbi:MAG TPA: hypothetical protein VGG56_10520 [Terracidiphilus sp.]